MTTTTTLAERYIAATVKSITPSAQDDVRAELAASIDDAIEARREQGELRAVAERAVLTELGDPAILAAGYADRPLHLIGPQYYLTWVRLLKMLWAIVPVTAMAGVAIANALADTPIAEIIGASIAVGIGAIIHVGFWTTLVFFILERTGADTGVRWSLDSLPEVQESGAGRGDFIASLVFLGVAAAALLWDRFIGFVFVANGNVDISEGLGAQTMGMSILHPGLWPWWLGAALILIGVRAAVTIAVFASRGWRPGLAAANTVLAMVFAAGSVYLLVTGQLLNLAFVEFTIGRGDVPDDVGHTLTIVLTAVIIIGIAVWDSINGWRKARRAATQA